MGWIIKNLGIGMVGFCIGKLIIDYSILAIVMFVGLSLIIIGGSKEMKQILKSL